MWKFKPFTQKEQAGLEGRIVDIGSFKIQVRNLIAEGGFSCVYSARDVLHTSKQYALKHMICNDAESLELVMKEISVMKTLLGHPNIVLLHSHTIFDMGRTKEALLLMEYCEKSLVNALDGRGAAFFEEKQALSIFRDVCNAVFAMHCQNPPIAHRDLKAENLLLGYDGLWKLCDFGSTSTNHKRFEKPEEMGIEEDVIRKHTTPAYRAPEMWDLYRRDPINEKVDIWALGCLLFRICYMKLAFDGESKLQVLNGNYRIPDLPKYNKSITDLIRDMLQPSPDNRPDITQVWFRVNDLLPESMRKSLPDTPKGDIFAGISNSSNKTSSVPRPSSSPQVSSTINSRASGSPAPLGAFWTTQHATEHKTSGNFKAATPPSIPKNSVDFNLFPEDVNGAFRNDASNASAVEFDFTKLRHVSKEITWETELQMVKKQLADVTAEKADMTSKCEKLVAICRSQRQEIQELKHALAAITPTKDFSKGTATPSLENDKIVGSVLELQQAFFDEASSPSQWHAFDDDTKRTKSWEFETQSFKVTTERSIGELKISQRANKSESKLESQPAVGWANF